jgi:hypothetical protein
VFCIANFPRNHQHRRRCGVAVKSLRPNVVSCSHSKRAVEESGKIKFYLFESKRERERVNLLALMRHKVMTHTEMCASSSVFMEKFSIISRVAAAAAIAVHCENSFLNNPQMTVTT